MAKCSYCGREIDHIPFKCNYCGLTFCREHRLPSAHGCKGVEKWRSGAKPSKPVKARVHALKGAEPKKRDGKLLQAYLLAVCLASFLIVFIGPMLSEPNPSTSLEVDYMQLLLSRALTPESIGEVKDVAMRLRAGGPYADALNVLRFVDERLEPGFSNVSPKTPMNILMSGRGTCLERAIAINGLLLAMGYRNAYFIVFKGPPNHIAAALSINGTIYVIDLDKPMSLTAYIHEYSKHFGGAVSEYKLYKVTYNEESVEVKLVGVSVPR